MAYKYINRAWEIDDWQDNEVAPDELTTPALSDDDNQICLNLTARQFIEMLSSIEQGSEICYPNKSHEISDRFLMGAFCDDLLATGCYTLSPEHEAYFFYPNDPYNLADGQIEHLFLGQQFRRFADVELANIPIIGQQIIDTLGDLTGYFPNDIFVTLFDINLFNNQLFQLLNVVDFVTKFQLPYIKLELIGSGRADLELLNVPLGGNAVIIKDPPTGILDTFSDLYNWLTGENELPSGWITTELNRDISSIPPETATTQIQRVQFPGDDDTEHELYIIFVPSINDEFPFFFPFGGIRSIELCNGLKVRGSQTGETYDILNYGIAPSLRQGVLPVSTIQDICEGVICAIEKISQRILLAETPDNVRYNIDIDKDTGAVTLQQLTSGKEPPPGSEAEAIVFGGALNVEYGLNAVLTAISDGYNAVPQVPEATVVLQLSARYDIDETLMTTAVGDYYTHAGTFGVLDNWNGLSDYIYCRGLNKQAIGAFLADEKDVDWLQDALQIRDAITDEQYELWYTDGQASPSNGYLDAPCFTFPPETFVITPDNYDTAINGIWTQTLARDTGHRWQFVVVGSLNRVADGRKIDLLYYEDSGGQFQSSGVAVLRNTASSTSVPFDGYPPYNSASSYTLFVTAPNVSFQYPGGFIGFPAIADPENDLTGQITITKYDLGNPT